MASTSIPESAFPAPMVIIQSEQEGEAIGVPAEAATLEGFRKWAASDAFPQQGRFSFVDGKVMVDMSPENLDLHNFLKGEISSVLRNVVRQLDLGRLFFDRCLLSNATAQLATEPDAMFLSYESHRAGRAQYLESRSIQGSYVEVIGAPDWILEIVSPSSRKKDREILRRAYHRAGIEEYWIADALGDEVELLVLVRGEADFVEVRPQGGWYRSPTFRAAFQLSRKKAPDGLWDYTLDVRPS